MIHFIFLLILAYYASRLSPIHNNLSGVMSMPAYHRPMQIFLILFLIYYWYHLYQLSSHKNLVHLSGLCLLISVFLPFKRSSHDFFSECHTYLGLLGITIVIIILILMIYDLSKINAYKAYQLLRLLMSCCLLLAIILCFLADITSLFEWLSCLSLILFLKAYQHYSQ